MGSDEYPEYGTPWGTFMLTTSLATLISFMVWLLLLGWCIPPPSSSSSSSSRNNDNNNDDNEIYGWCIRYTPVIAILCVGLNLLPYWDWFVDLLDSMDMDTLFPTSALIYFIAVPLLWVFSFLESISMLKLALSRLVGLYSIMHDKSNNNTTNLNLNNNDNDNNATMITTPTTTITNEGTAVSNDANAFVIAAALGGDHHDDEGYDRSTYNASTTADFLVRIEMPPEPCGNGSGRTNHHETTRSVIAADPPLVAAATSVDDDMP